MFCKILLSIRISVWLPVSDHMIEELIVGNPPMIMLLYSPLIIRG